MALGEAVQVRTPRAHHRTRADRLAEAPQLGDQPAQRLAPRDVTGRCRRAAARGARSRSRRSCRSRRCAGGGSRAACARALPRARPGNPGSAPAHSTTGTCARQASSARCARLRGSSRAGETPTNGTRSSSAVCSATSWIAAAARDERAGALERARERARVVRVGVHAARARRRTRARATRRAAGCGPPRTAALACGSPARERTGVRAGRIPPEPRRRASAPSLAARLADPLLGRSDSRRPSGITTARTPSRSTTTGRIGTIGRSRDASSAGRGAGEARRASRGSPRSE